MNTSFLLFLSLFILGAALFLTSKHSADIIIYAQFQNNTSNFPLPGVNITSPPRGQQIPINISELNMSGKSTDRPAADDCQVSIIVNDVKPYQPAMAIGTTGENNDYSEWSFILNSNYTSIKEGVNKITAKLSCLPNVTSSPNNITKWYSINVTGTATAATNNTTNNTTTSILTPVTSSPTLNSSAQVESESNQPQSLDSAGNEEQDTNEKIGEQIDSLKDRILE
jgi:hypothetical protein